MAEFYSYLTMILCLLTGGGNDLLDYLPTESFWAQKNVAVSVEAMVKELMPRPSADVTKLIADLGAPDAATRDAAAQRIREIGGGGAATKALTEAADSPNAEVRGRARTLLRDLGGDDIELGVRRLMAIRTLGEIGKAEALPTLKPLLNSKELFEADYAKVAIDQVEGRTPSASAMRPVAPRVVEDVWLLPADCKTVGQLVPRRGSPLGIAEFMAAMKGKDELKKNADAASAVQTVLEIVERIGNVRVDAATFGVSGTLVDRRGGPAPGYVALVVRGKYHSGYLRMLAKSAHYGAGEESGIEIFKPNGELTWLMPSDEVFVFLASPTGAEAPAAELARAVKAGKGPLAGDEAAHKRIEALDTKQILWGASTVTPDQKSMPVAEAFDTITLSGTREAKTLKIRMTAKGSDPEKVKAAADKTAKHAKDSADFLSGIHMSIILMSADLLRSVKLESSGTTATLTAQLETTPAAILSLPVLADEDELPAPRAKPATRPSPSAK
jgi:hypothetical protein